MALNYNIIDNKKIAKTSTGEEYIDLMSQTYNYEPDKADGEFMVVNKYYVARPDLISLVAYKDDKYADFICKVNGISNPFELAEDTVLFIPNAELLPMYSSGAKEQSAKIADENTDVLSSFSTGHQKRRNEKRTSNEQLIGESNYTIDRTLGIVFY